MKKIHKDWIVQPEAGEILVFPFTYYGLLPAKKLLYHKDAVVHLVESSGKLILWYKTSGYMDEVMKPSTLDAICKSDFRSLELRQLVRANTHCMPGHCQTIIKSLPEHWFLDMDTMTYPFLRRGLPPAKALMYGLRTSAVLVECNRKFMFWQPETGDIEEILHPTTITRIVDGLAHMKDWSISCISEHGDRSVEQNITCIDDLTDQQAYMFDKRGCSSWTSEEAYLGTLKEPFRRHGLPPGQISLLDKETQFRLVESSGRVFIVREPSEFAEILIPRRLKDIQRTLPDLANSDLSDWGRDGVLMKNLPKGWTTVGVKHAAREFPYRQYDLDPPQMLFHNRKGICVLQCDELDILWNKSSGSVKELLGIRDKIDSNEPLPDPFAVETKALYPVQADLEDSDLENETESGVIAIVWKLWIALQDYLTFVSRRALLWAGYSERRAS